MGCRGWSKIALLVVFLGVSLGSSAATRKHVSMPSAHSVSSNPGGSPTKSGDTFSIPGNPIEGEYLPGVDPSKSIKIDVSPKIDFSIPTTINAAKSVLRGGGLAGALLGAAMQGMLDSVGSFIDDQGDVVKNGLSDPLPNSGVTWIVTLEKDYYFSSAPEACQARWNYSTVSSYYTGIGYPAYSGNVNYSPTTNPASATCLLGNTTSSFYTVYRSGSTCSSGSLDPSTGTCRTTSQVPLSETDWTNMGTFAEGQSADWLNDLLQESCSGSLDPASCVDSLKVDSSLSGPSTVTAPTSTTTTTYTKSDGTTGTQVSTTTTKFDITYGDTYYDYSKTTTVKVTEDGQQVSESSTTEDPAVTEEPAQEEEDYSFTDTEFPTVEPFYEQKYPDGLSGVWQSRSADVDNSAFFSFLRSFVPSFSGSCPTFGLTVDVGIVNFGHINFDSLCWVFEFVGTIILATAVFTARQLMMGG